MSIHLDLNEEVSFNPSIADAAAEREAYNFGYVRCNVKRVKKAFTKKKPELEVSPHYYKLDVTLTPLSDPEDPGSGVGKGQRTTVCLPIEPARWEQQYADGEIDEGTLKQWRRVVKMWHEIQHGVIQALVGEDEVPDFPAKGNDGEWYFRGEMISTDEIDACRKEVTNAVQRNAVEIWNSDPSRFEDALLYCEFAAQVDKETKEPTGYMNVRNYSVEHPIRSGEEVDLLTGMNILS